MSEFEEKRSFQRLQLAEPIEATLDGRPALVLDVGVAGALVEHAVAIEAGAQTRLKFTHEGQTVEFECEVARTTSPQPLPSGVIQFPGAAAPSRNHQSGVRFLRGLGESDERLRTMLSDHVTRILRAQQANAMGERQQNVIDGDSTITSLGAARRSADSGFYRFRFGPDGWKKTFALLPDQPADGFTVAAFEDEDHLEGLCRAYEAADDQGRNLIRLMAELSIKDPAARKSS